MGSQIAGHLDTRVGHAGPTRVGAGLDLSRRYACAGETASTRGVRSGGGLNVMGREVAAECEKSSRR